DVRSFFALDAFTDRVQDAVGAGDALLAYAALSLFASKSSLIASVLGSLAAAVECEHEGNVPVPPADIIANPERVERFVNYYGLARRLRSPRVSCASSSSATASRARSGGASPAATRSAWSTRSARTPTGATCRRCRSTRTMPPWSARRMRRRWT